MAGPLAAVWGLVVDLGRPLNRWIPRGRWARPPSADYRCPCGYTASASGDAVGAAIGAARREHRRECPPQQKEA